MTIKLQGYLFNVSTIPSRVTFLNGLTGRPPAPHRTNLEPARPPSMEIVTGDGLGRGVRRATGFPAQESQKRPETFAFYGEGSVLFLQAAFDDQGAATAADGAENA